MMSTPRKKAYPINLAEDQYECFKSVFDRVRTSQGRRNVAIAPACGPCLLSLISENVMYIAMILFLLKRLVPA